MKIPYFFASIPLLLLCSCSSGGSEGSAGFVPAVSTAVSTGDDAAASTPDSVPGSTQSLSPASVSSTSLHFIDCATSNESVIALDPETGEALVRRSGNLGLCLSASGTGITSVTVDGRYAVSFWGSNRNISEFTIVELEREGQRTITEKDIRVWLDESAAGTPDDELRDLYIVGFDRTTGRVFFQYRLGGIPTTRNVQTMTQQVDSIIEDGLNPVLADEVLTCHFSFHWSPSGQSCASRVSAGRRGVLDQSGETRFFSTSSTLTATESGSETTQYPLDCGVEKFTWGDDATIYFSRNGSIYRGELTGRCARFFLDSGVRPNNLLGAFGGSPIVWSLSADASRIEVSTVRNDADIRPITELSAALRILGVDVGAEPRLLPPFVYWRLLQE